MESRIRNRSRRRLLGLAAGSLPLLWLGGLSIRSFAGEAMTSIPMSFEPLDLGDARWREILDADEYRVLRREGTERAGSSALNDEKRAGTFICAGCFLPLFSSEHKYESGTGWPSFYQPIHPDHMDTKKDFRLIWPRTEYHCARCGGHQGHVFDDGPEPTGQRWCNNGVALEFVPEGEDLPEMRTS
ncbi:peptide-methionine (R)-S-oxide reductase MsrB [Wenzhouxiangella sp. EGI_FJ10305]|uniref:peptide-methionine (R)-S-oxide reductase MsrB n=1 Tax=Wenzhouxiangella sp. EGI_FJ10305 TaxID=3243768 RepID=UPI0035DAD252